MRTPQHIWVGRLEAPALSEQPIEIVERKGTGHPDTICDGVMEEVSLSLSREYLYAFGFIPHYNVDKGLLIAGAAEHRLGGGRVLKPMRFVFGDRATFEVAGKRLPVEEIVVDAARRWLSSNLPRIDLDRHLVYQVELREGAPELAGIFRKARGPLKANDTSAAVGYAPLTETERLVLESERFLNSTPFKGTFPETGEDVKVMGFRVEKSLDLIVAMPLLDRYVTGEEFYFRRKEEIIHALQAHIEPLLHGIVEVHISLNTLDLPGRGVEGMYLSVLGTSAENGDSGEVGRGNRVNGVISLNRPVSAEAASGKNPVSHPGKIYNVLSHKLAERIHKEVPGIREVYVWLCSQIGLPIDQPRIAAAQLVLDPDMRLNGISSEVEVIIQDELSTIEKLVQDLVAGRYRLY